MPERLGRMMMGDRHFELKKRFAKLERDNLALTKRLSRSSREHEEFVEELEERVADLERDNQALTEQLNLKAVRVLGGEVTIEGPIGYLVQFGGTMKTATVMTSDVGQLKRISDA